ncbi:bifunctional 2-C-methyl-D-erythritol 4-phosphate cytidylyltransferase/2-C-methyl-D-erythritol 2,4-cyclodiphosphate synthase [Aquisediminimonas sediminicola]|uniref:bifunctional 2-C-methyl-D-erythritol 4-phosphate cytidylyltransferase/2-C-methyl-D-erythritol 2,4-cyclodiphosphate synthase n=1 Tax=Alteraquisediminimonas sediminicola TaxID=2676787 RepID=UPI001C8E1964|nr:bifunctional 2-C-methyl-D-erythritol 4-phosphate cytidylyltransferase/2-C-methyl-D-erythritol 2,4-cyclodiphosphate synthase [Aquisediminimonas sediminicola]
MTERPNIAAPPKTIALIVAAGAGVRAGLNAPKQFQPFAGQTVLAHSVRALLTHHAIDAVWIVTGADQFEACRAAIGPFAAQIRMVAGGATRRESVLNGLNAIAEAGRCGQILIHDAARPGLPHRVIDDLIAALATHEGAIPVLPVADSLSNSDGDDLGQAVSRDDLWRVQTPQAFRFAGIYHAHQIWDDSREATDDARILQADGGRVAMVKGDAYLDKLTYHEDFARMEALMTANWRTRTGMGFDVHRFEPGDTVHLCGVPIPHDQRLAGHSDADVALHALTDALLGAIADGDIGQHFPPSDPQYKGAASHRFVEFARDRIAQRGGVIEHVDVTIICEAPKIGPHRDAMRHALSAMLQLDLDSVSVKATTTEQLGFTGRREGIAAQAIATVRIGNIV